MKGLESGSRPALLGSSLFADGIHLNDAATSSSVDMGEGGVGEEKAVEQS